MQKRTLNATRKFTVERNIDRSMTENAKDEFGMRLFRNKSDAVTKALKEFLAAC